LVISGLKVFDVDELNFGTLSLTGTVVHPKAAIYALSGPIVIGSNNIIEEGCIIVNRLVYLNLLTPYCPNDIRFL